MSINEQKILIVDDDPIVLKSLKDLLTVRGYNATTAIGGQEAICQLNQNNFDLVQKNYQQGNQKLSCIAMNGWQEQQYFMLNNPRKKLEQYLRRTQPCSAEP